MLFDRELLELMRDPDVSLDDLVTWADARGLVLHIEAAQLPAQADEDEGEG